MGDIKTDGKFIIENGGLTQGIQKELNLSNEECNELQKNSIWNEITKEFDDPNNITVIERDAKSSNSNSGIQNAIVQFSKESWHRIVDLVNRILHRNIQVEDDTESSNTGKVEKQANETPPEEQVTASQAFEDRRDKKPADLTENDVYLMTMYNDIQFANKKGVKLGDKYYDFNQNGDCERIYRNKPTENMNGTKDSYTLLLYDENGEVKQIYQYLNEGEIDSDGTRTCGVYDKDGKLSSFYIESSFNPVSKEAQTIKYYTDTGEFEDFSNFFFDENGKKAAEHYHAKDGKTNTICIYDKDGKTVFTYDPNEELDNYAFKVFSALENPTEENLQAILNEIDNADIKIDDDNEYTDVNNLYFVMSKYSECTGRYMLDDIAQKNKQFADYLINFIKAQETAETDTTFKYTKNILADMAEHPDDYKKLSVDLQRLMHRPLIDKEDFVDDNHFKLNNKIDKTVQQTLTGNCYLISNISSIDSKPLGRKALNSIRQNLPNGDVLITCKGNNKTYLITKEEILDSDHLSIGDNDMRVFELAMDKYRRDAAYADPRETVDDYSGTLKEVCKAFFGVDVETECDISKLDFEEVNNKNFVFEFSISTDDKTITLPKASKEDDENVDIVLNHSYRIVKVSSGRLYFTNPWNTSEELSIPIEDFKKMKDLKVSKFDLNLIK